MTRARRKRPSNLAPTTSTFFFTDMEGSTRYWDASPDAMRAAVERHDTLLKEGIEQHRGRVVLERGEGDSFFAIFENPADAIAAAATTQRALAAEPWPEAIPIKVRMAIHTGEADDALRGTDVNRCARLRAIAHGGQVLVSAAARDAARMDARGGITLIDLGLHRLRDLTQPERVFQLQHAELPASFPPLRSMEAFRHNLPVQLSTFVGRDRELAELGELLGERHVVTLTGTGGSGKTRLALQLAADQLDAFEDGCWFVDLAPLADPLLVARAAAQVLEVRDEPGRPLLDAIAQRVGGKRLLLVLDNCEHVIQAAAEVADALARRAPALRIVATSREPLSIPGELIWHVPSLALPDVDRLPSAKEIFDFEAVRLFCDRAAEARSGFVPDARDGPAIARMCARLDGIPLAIELAAARIRVLAPNEILVRLEDRFRLLTGGSRVLTRHQTLRAAVEWSHQLLTDAERVLFRRLAPFAGTFDLVAAERVAAGEPLEETEVLELLSNLVDKSLLLADQVVKSSVRYRLLETLHEYATERLEESDEHEAVHDRHLVHYLDLAEAAYAERIEAEGAWLERLEHDHDNLRVALAWARKHRPVDHLRLAGAIGWFWQLHGHLSEGRARLGEALAAPWEPSSELARALWSAGTLAGWQGDFPAARSSLEESREMYEAMGDRLGAALCLDSLGWASLLAGDDERALRSFEEALGIQRELGNPRLIELSKVAVCQALVALGDMKQAEPMAREILAVALKNDDARNIHFGYHFWADSVLSRGDGAEAEPLYRESLRAALAYGDKLEAIYEVEGVAMSAACGGDARRGLRLGGAAEARKNELGVDLGVGFWEAYRARFFGPARATLGPVEASAAWAEGRAMGWEAAVSEALEEATHSATS